eukprot:GEMP01023492.1.p1 GENE.GEMP01023492.1~~GEMP01023492.1.p1  ORF type:complete len:437 (-),score=110.78 GEMP01023492.1:1187-2428(-)
MDAIAAAQGMAALAGIAGMAGITSLPGMMMDPSKGMLGMTMLGPGKGMGMMGMMGKGGKDFKGKGGKDFKGKGKGKGKSFGSVPKGGGGGAGGRTDCKGNPIDGSDPALGKAQYMDPVAAAQLAQIQAQNHSTLLDELLPLVSSTIDSNGGVMRIETIAMRSNVKSLMNRIQEPYKKTLNDLLAEWTDFFHMMPEGLVGTNAGYDSGLIMQDGSLNSDYIWKFVSPSATKPESPSEDEKLVRAADNLFHAIMDLSSEESLITAYNELKQTRALLTGKILEPIKPKKAMPGVTVMMQGTPEGTEALALPPHERQEWIVRQIMITMRTVPDKILQISQIFGDVGQLKNGIFVKGKEFLERYPSLFSIHPMEGATDPVNPPLCVALLDNGTDVIPPPLPAVHVGVWNNSMNKRPRY